MTRCNDAYVKYPKLWRMPIRMCTVCRQRYPKHELRRFVLRGINGDRDEFGFDPHQTMSGRGIYICQHTVCMETFRRKSVRQKEKGDSA